MGAFRAALEEKLLLARFFHEQLQEIPGFELGPTPDLSIVLFRYRPARADINLFNRRLVKRLQVDGRVFLSSTTLGGDVWLRMAVLNARTHLDAVRSAIDVIQCTAGEVEKD